MKHKRILLSIAMATIVLVSLCTLSVSAANGGRANVQASAALVGAPVGSGPAVAAAGVDNLGLFVRGADNALWWRHFNGNDWTAWSSLGGVLTSDPAAVAFSSSGISGTAVAVRGTDGAIWATVIVSGYGNLGWQQLSGQLYDGTGPAITATADASGTGHIQVFATGTDQALWHQEYTITTAGSISGSGWESLGGVLTWSPAAVPTGSSAMLAFGHGTDNALWYRSYSGSGWSDWQTLGGQLLAGTGPASSVSNKIDVFVIGTDHATWHRSYTGAWSGWESLGGASYYSPTATGEGSSYTDVFVTGTNGNLFWKYSPGTTTTWSNWLDVGPGPL